MTNVAIACQGGGSHTAFTAGVLDEVLPWLEAHDCDLVGLSGTSGGAISAVAAWYGHQTGGAAAACEVLEGIWADVVTSNPVERLVNEWAVWGLQAASNGAPVPTFSPYAVPWESAARRRFLRTVERHVDFEAFPSLVSPDAPELVIGTVDVEAGDFETFTNEDVTAEAVLASAAVPTIFEAVELHGHGHWDGLFSQNPPIHDLMSVEAGRKPDELWIVQINPQATDEVPRTLQEINDRRHELSANISLNQEVRFIETVNDWVAAGDLSGEHFTHTEVRKIQLDGGFSNSTKFKRTPRLIEELLGVGRTRAADFLDRVADDLVA